MLRLPSLAALNALRGRAVVRTVVSGKTAVSKPKERPARVQGRSAGEAEFLLHLRAAGLSAPRTEFEFHPERGWRFDTAWPERRIAIEVEGGIWMKGGGAHSRPGNIERDIEKYNAAAELGWMVYRVTTGMVMDGRALVLAERILRERPDGHSS